MPYDEPRGTADAPDVRSVVTRSEVPAERRPDGAAPAASRPAAAPPAEPPNPPVKRRSPWLRIILIVVVLGAVAGGVYYWWATRDIQSTDDAYTDGRVITIAPKVAGYVTELAITDNERVKAGQVLIRIDPRPFIAARDQARGQLAAAQGQLANARTLLAVGMKSYPARLASAQAQRDSARAALARADADFRRQHGLSAAATTQQSVDNANAALLQARATLAQAEAGVTEAEPVQQNLDGIKAQAQQIDGQVAQAQAQLDAAELNLGYTTVTAPQDGWVTKRNVERGSYVSEGTAILALVAPDVWITANFKENELDRMRPGQHVDISVDAYPGLKLGGHVDSIQLGSGSRFSAFPAENATGNYVKIVQRVPVKILIDTGMDPNLPLPIGLSAVPTVALK